MKKTLYPLVLTMLFSITAMTAFSQNKERLVKPQQMQAAPAPQEMETGINLIPPANPAVSHTQRDLPVRTRSSTEVTIGMTQYDLQTNASICNRFTRTAGGKMFGVWTMGFEETAYPDRGTGYNANDGSAWGAMPSVRLESTARTGWPNYVRTASGTEFIVDHVFDSGAFRLHYLRREAGATDWTEGDMPTSTPFGTLWPRAAGGGADGNSIHVIAITTPVGNGGAVYEGVHMHILYYRSQDAGATWDVVDGILPGLDSTSMKNLVRADGYAIQAKGDVVAIGVFSPFNDVALLKSTDNGGNWTRTVVHDFPIDLYDVDQGYTVDDLPPYDSTLSPGPIAIFSSDGAGALAIDNDDMVHIFYGEMFVQDTNTTDGNWFYFPCTSGLAYWNENFGPDSIRTIADVEDLDGNGTFDVDCGTFDFGRYGISGLTSFPSAGVDPQNNIYFGYMAVMEGDEFYHPEDGQHNHHIYLMASTDGGENWTTPYDIVNEDILVEPELASLTETAYPHLAPLVDDKVHFIYQQDFRPGLSVIGDQDITEDNLINYVGVNVTLFGVTPTVEPAGAKPLHLSVMPNPASGLIRLMYDLPENAQVQVSLLDLLGKEALRANGLTGFEGLNMGTINIGNLSPGVYFVRLKAGERTVVRKLVVK